MSTCQPCSLVYALYHRLEIKPCRLLLLFIISAYSSFNSRATVKISTCGKNKISI